jgi:hypothetical protein
MFFAGSCMVYSIWTKLKILAFSLRYNCNWKVSNPNVYFIVSIFGGNVAYSWTDGFTQTNINLPMNAYYVFLAYTLVTVNIKVSNNSTLLILSVSVLLTIGRRELFQFFKNVVVEGQ